jgi:hypothetical protein
LIILGAYHDVCFKVESFRDSRMECQDGIWSFVEALECKHVKLSRHGQ